MPVLLFLILAVAAAALGVMYGRLVERASWTRRLYERGINPSTLAPRGGTAPEVSVEPLGANADAMRDAMEEMAREVQRLSEGQRFITEVLSEKRVTDDRAPGANPPTPPGE